MIRYLQNRDIDREAWDRSVTEAENPVPYCASWYLDIVHPGWEALVMGDYEALMPLTGSRKFGISYLHTPFFVQQLGLVSIPPPQQELMESFLGAIPRKFRFINLNLNYMNHFVPLAGELVPHTNLVLDLSRSYGEISQSYHENTRRNLSRSEPLPPGNENVMPAGLIRLFRSGRFADRYPDQAYLRLHSLMTTSLERGSGFLRGVWKNDRLVCGAFFLELHGRLLFLFSGNSRDGLDSGAMFRLVDEVIRVNAGKELLLDFEGSDDGGLARFYRGFGARMQPYFTYRLDRLPSMISRCVRIR